MFELEDPLAGPDVDGETFMPSSAGSPGPAHRRGHRVAEMLPEAEAAGEPDDR